MRALAAGLVFAALPSAAQQPSLQGHWQATIAADPTFVGVVLIDGAGRVTWDAKWDRQYRISVGSTEVGDGNAKWRGYVRHGTPTMELVLTNGAKVDRMHCARQSSDLLHCYSFLSDGKPSAPTILTRVGPGPVSLMPGTR